MMETMTVPEIVEKLVGKIEPNGETISNTQALQNLNNLANVINSLLSDLSTVAAKDKNGLHRHDAVIQKAQDWMVDFSEWFEYE